MTKVKFISGYKLAKIQSDVNEFLESKGIDIIDLKITMASHIMVCSIVYKLKQQKMKNIKWGDNLYLAVFFLALAIGLIIISI